MYKKIRYVLVSIIAILLLNIPINIDFAEAEDRENYPYKPNDIEIVKALEYLKNRQAEDGGISGVTVTAWAAMAISASEQSFDDWGNLIDYLEKKSMVLDPDKATDWERHNLAIIACNENPNNFSEIDFIEKIIGFYDGTQFDEESIYYDDYFGIISLISSGFKTTDSIVQNTKSYIIGKQDENGGWGDADSTAAAIMALISAGEENDSKVITDGLSHLKTLQTNNGGFRSWSETNAASTAWAVMAIVATNNNPTSNYWKKNGNDPITYLINLQQKDGSFNWAEDKSINPEWMTTYAIPALLGRNYPVKINQSAYKENNRPNKPNKPSGPNSGRIGTSYVFTSTGTDQDNDRLQYRFDWGDGTFSKWTNLVSSGTSKSLSKKWNKAGNYIVKAQTRDIHGLTSFWSNEHNIKINKKIEEKDYWTGFVRIEGKNDTIWSGNLEVFETNIYAKNVETEIIEKHYISYPSLLGALDKAASIGDFSYNILFLPNKNSFLISSIENDSDWWYFLVDFKKPIFSTKDYRLNDNDNEILFCYLEKEECKALKLFINKTKINKNENTTIRVFDENDSYVPGADIYVREKSYKTDEKGNLTISFNESGNYQIYSEKNGYVRSKKENIKVKKSLKIIKPLCNCFYILNFQLFDKIERTWVIGAVDIEIETSEDISKVDFYINNKLIYSDNSSPYIFRLNEKSFFNKTEIIVKSYLMEKFDFEILIEKIDKIIEMIISKYGDVELISQLDFLKNYLLNLDRTYYIEEDIDSIELIIFNMFPQLHI
ncbi:hypothetical protein AYK21_05335 [Thermoplasmatales archaeon SG8-52-2]|nr:MAG: hypothetical protein AYK21_05335 [Thermoplasmatales archaeon SG8-52-2]